MRIISRQRSKNFSTILLVCVYLRSTGRDANDARLRVQRSAIVSPPGHAWGGASPHSLVEHSGARRRSARRNSQAAAAGRSSRFSVRAQEGPARSSRRFGAWRRAAASLSGRSKRDSCATAHPSISYSWCASATTASTRRLASERLRGVVAYSAICTHQGCPVNQWSKEKLAMVCSCHASTYDPKNGAKVIFGPAPLPLAALPLKSDNGQLVVAGGFIGRVGGQTD